jgi:hypothetical protein
VSYSEDLLASCSERSQAPIREIIFGRKKECRRDLIELSRDSPHGRFIQRPGIRDNSDGVPCQRALWEGLDKGIPDLHSVLFTAGRSSSESFLFPLLKAAATEFGIDA